MSMASN